VPDAAIRPDIAGRLQRVPEEGTSRFGRLKALRHSEGTSRFGRLKALKGHEDETERKRKN
jgi:hypothetical protein